MRKLCLWVALILALAALSAGAEALTCGDYEYIAGPDGTVRITGWTGSDAELEIPGELDGLAVTAIGSEAFAEREALERVTLPEGLREIGDCAFAHCLSLVSINLPASLEALGMNPFRDCAFLTGIALDEGQAGFEVMDDGALYADGGRRLVFYPGGLPMDSYAVPEGVERIDDFAFSHCAKLVSVSIPSSVTEIGENAFEGHENLTLTVERDSCAEAFARSIGVKYTYPDANDWLNG